MFESHSKFPFFKQLDSMDCGPACLRMIAKFYGKSFSLQSLREHCAMSKEGISLFGISGAAEAIGMRTRGVRLSFDQLSEVSLPCVAHWSQNHFVVVYDINEKRVLIGDPAHDLISCSPMEFKQNWESTVVDGVNKGIALLLEPTPDFYERRDEHEKASFAFLFSYLTPYKRYVAQLAIGLLLGSLLQLIFPFLTQAIVDFGIQQQNISFVYLILIAQLILYFSEASVGFIRSWILLHVTSRVNIAFISDFLIKLMKLPISFFDTKLVGDILQRIDDHRRLEAFLTATSLGILFSVFNLLVFGLVLLIYSWKIFFVFLLASALTWLWVSRFMSMRRALDHKRFEQLAKNQSALIQLIRGMPEIKLNSCERQKRWEWEEIQARLFKVSIKGLTVDQYQAAGTTLINGTKNIFISFIAAKLVIEGQMTLGMMMAVQFLIGQLNAPIEQLLLFFRTAQDAKISLERMAEIHGERNESEPQAQAILSVPGSGDLLVRNLSFGYLGEEGKLVLEDLELAFPRGKTTAIVGVSGSGKTTLIKLLLKFYQPNRGAIFLGNTGLTDISSDVWRRQCGVVMQDGFLFHDTIARNIALGVSAIDQERLRVAAQLSNIEEFIESLPLRYNTMAGEDGVSFSQGQKQRLLIARAVYKNPEFLFFDEATSSLDANNEREIIEKLESFCRGRTVLIVAHRLSTVKGADQIVVLEQGRIVELGNHESLTQRRGAYYNLVKNQLELGT